MNENKNETLDDILKDSTLENPELTFCEKTTYLDFLLSNAKTEEEKEQIKATINNFLEISKEDTEEIPVIDEENADLNETVSEDEDNEDDSLDDEEDEEDEEEEDE